MSARRHLVFLIASLAALVSIGPVGSAFAADPSAATDTSQKALQRVEKRVVCPSCGRPLDRSTGPAAERMRVFIREGLDDGMSEDEVVSALVAEYGGEQRVLTDPPRKGVSGLMIWGVPLLIAAIGAVVLGAVVIRWRKR